MPKASRQHYYSSISLRHLTPYTEERWSEYFSLSASPKKPILYKNTKVKVRSPDGDTDYFDIVAGVLQGYLFIICLDYVLKTSIDLMKENDFKLAKERSISYPAQTITDADYADDIVLLANSPAQAESLLHSLEQAADSIGFDINADKTEYTCFNKKKR